VTTGLVGELDLLEGDLAQRVEALGLTQNVIDLSTKGYTVVEDAAPTEFFDALRERIVELVDEQRAAGAVTSVGDIFSESAWLLLGRGRVFEEAVCLPKWVTLNEVVLGKGFQIQVCGGTVKGQGAPAMPLHTDSSHQAEPFSEQAFGLTSLWACNDWTEDGGSTRLVPNSFRQRRNPQPGEGEGETIPIECPKGSILFWNAATWHGAGARTVPGTRIGFHTPCTHISLRTLESYDHLSDEIVDRNPAVFARMIGRSDAYGKQTETTIPVMELAQMMQWANSPRSAQITDLLAPRSSEFDSEGANA
jgi:hypothetical protein